MTDPVTLGRRELLATAGAVFAAPAVAAREVLSYRRIAVEEGFSTPEVEIANSRGILGLAPGSPRAQLRSAMNDLGTARIASMDAAGISLALLLLSAPGVQNIRDMDEACELAELVNERAFEAVVKHPERFAALAAVAPQSPQRAAQELERAVGKLGAKGAVINSHTHGEYLDDAKFWPIFEAAQALDVPIYLHPREPSFGMPGPLEMPGMRVGWSFGVEAATHILRVIQSGALDTFPRLKIVIGHLGEMIPFYFDRIDNRYAWELNLNGLTPRAKRLPSRYFQDNIFLTSSGVNYWEPVRYTIERVGIDRLMFAADHPYEDQAICVEMADRFPLSTEAKAKFYEGNAVRVFKL